MNITPNEGAGAESLVDDAGQAANTAPEANAESANEAPKQEEVKSYTAEDFQRLEKQLKKEQRRIDQRTARMYQAEAKNQELLARLEKLETNVNNPKKGRPVPDQFQNWGEYEEARDNWVLEQAKAPKDAAPSAQNASPQEAQWMQQRETEIVQHVRDLSKVIPDFEESIGAASDIVDALPWQTRKALYESQHPALAAYVLEREGALDRLFDATPQQAAQLIAQATQIGVENIKQWAAKNPPKQATNAPPPLASARGASSGGKPLQKQSWSELKKSLDLS